MANRLSAAVICALALLCSVQFSYSQATIRITPTSSNEGKFIGQEFSRVCALTVNQNGVLFEWLHNGQVVNSATGSNLQLDISSVGLSDAGDYECRATLNDGMVLGPVSAGRLTVFDTAPIFAPSNQYLIHSSDSTLNCSYNMNGVTVISSIVKDGQVLNDAQITGANLDDEGEYECDIYLPTSGASINVPFQVHVIVPIQVTSQPPAHQLIEGNIPLSLTVNFTGRMEQNISVTWYKDGRPLSEALQSYVSTRYNGLELTGSTSLDTPAIQRRDSGVYRVVLQGQLGAGTLSQELLYREVSFQITVNVPPSLPGDFNVDQSSITSVFARLRWTNTNQTADEGAETLTLLLMFGNMSIAQQIELSGDATQITLDLIPGTEYSARLRAENPSGMVITDAITIETLAGTPKVNEITVSQVEEGPNFQVSVSLAYTGGGAIRFFDVSYRLSTEDGFTQLDNVPAVASSDSLVWTGTFSISDADFDPEAVQFLVSVENERGFKSDSTLSSAVTRPIPSTTTTPASGTGGDALPPIWLFIIVAVLGTVAVTITVVCLCFFIVRSCRKGRKNKNVYNINKEQPNGDIERGPVAGNSYEQTEPNNVMLHRSEPQPLDMNYINAIHSGNGSVPSIKTSSSSPTPQPDEHLLKKAYIHHQKYPSDASSSIKRGHTPSTTASSSPGPSLIKAHFEQQRLREDSSQLGDSGSGMFSPISSERIGSYGPHVNESSQTESENVHMQMQEETGSYNHHHHRTYSHSSQNSTIPLSRIGTSASNISVPSSVRSSQPSLANSSSICMYQQNGHHPYTNHVLPGSVGQQAPGSGRAESICSYTTVTTVGGDSVSSRLPSLHDSHLQTTV